MEFSSAENCSFPKGHIYLAEQPMCGFVHWLIRSKKFPNYKFPPKFCAMKKQVFPDKHLGSHFILLLDNENFV